jgi:hypothetical protein
MNVSTLFYLISCVPDVCTEAPLIIEDVSMASFPDVIDYLDNEEVCVRDTVVQEILLKVKK